MLAGDAADIGYTVQRRRPGGPWQIVSPQPITTTTELLDQTPQPGAYEYRIADGRFNSRAVRVDSAAPPTNIVCEIPLAPQAADELELTFGHLLAADVDNDGRLDFTTCNCEGNRAAVRAYTRDGRCLWVHDTRLPFRGGWDGRWHHAPFLAWDINGDGRTEVVFHRGSGDPYSDDFYAEGRDDESLVAVDAETGSLLWQAPWPGRQPRVMMTVGHLNGLDRPAAIVVQDGTSSSSPILFPPAAGCAHPMNPSSTATTGASSARATTPTSARR